MRLTACGLSARAVRASKHGPLHILRGFEPRKGALAPRKRCLAPRETALARRMTALAPRESAVAPRRSGVAPRERALAPFHSALAPRRCPPARLICAWAQPTSALASLRTASDLPAPDFLTLGASPARSHHDSILAGPSDLNENEKIRRRIRGPDAFSQVPTVSRLRNDWQRAHGFSAVSMPEPPPRRAADRETRALRQ